MWLWVIVGALLVAAAGIGVVVLALTLRAVREARGALGRCADALEQIAVDAKLAAQALEATRDHGAQAARDLAAVAGTLGRATASAVGTATALLPGPFGKVGKALTVLKQARPLIDAVRHQRDKSAT